MKSNEKIKILCVDDEYIDNDWESRFNNFFPSDFQFIWTQFSDQVIPILKKEEGIKAIILDLTFKNQTLQGKDILKQLEESEFKEKPVIIFTADDSPKAFLEVSALSQKKPYDYFIKDSLDYDEATQTLLYANDNSTENPNFLKGESDGIKKVRQNIRLFAKVDHEKDSPLVLILGETGTGKELVAKSIHKYSKIRRKKKFVGINIAAIPSTLIESELFGHVPGAYTDAKKKRDGAFKVAKGGILFLDEIGELPLYLQVKLLRVLQEKKVQPLGSDTTFEIDDVRIIAATNANIFNQIKKGKFREDLFYRLYGCQITIPSLNERKEDIKILVKYFLSKYHYLNSNILDIDYEVIRKMENFDWKGNVRQLEKMVEYSFVLSNQDTTTTLELRHFPYLEHPAIEEKDFDLDELKQKLRVIAKKIWNEILSGEREPKTLDEIDKEFNISLGELVGREAIKYFNRWLTQEQEEKYFGYKPSKSASSRHLISYFQRRGIKSLDEIKGN